MTDAPDFRPMTEADLDAVLAIEIRAYDHPWTKGIFGDCIRVGYECWIAELDGEMAGYGVLSVGAGESHVLNVAVAPERQGQGLGRRILMHLLDRARRQGAEQALLEVRPSNEKAIRLYEDVGFCEICRRPGYYPGQERREDAIVYALQLL